MHQEVEFIRTEAVIPKIIVRSAKEICISDANSAPKFASPVKLGLSRRIPFYRAIC